MASHDLLVSVRRPLSIAKLSVKLNKSWSNIYIYIQIRVLDRVFVAKFNFHFPPTITRNRDHHGIIRFYTIRFEHSRNSRSQLKFRFHIWFCDETADWVSHPKTLCNPIGTMLLHTCWCDQLLRHFMNVSSQLIQTNKESVAKIHFLFISDVRSSHSVSICEQIFDYLQCSRW